MRKVVILFFILICLFPLISAVITGDTITGGATQSVGLNITVTALFPTLAILNPENKTYISNDSLLLNYTVVNEQAVWYNLDNGENTTLSSFTYFNTSQGSHTLYLFANSSLGNMDAENVTFTIDSTLLTILYEEYKGSNSGGSNNFYSHPYGDLQNLSDIVLENTLYGKISFNEVINLTNDEDFSDSLVDLDNNTNISFNEIDLNSTVLSNFDVGASLVLYNLTFTMFRILRDGVVCLSAICSQNSYTGGNLSFNVTGFSVYSAEETPEDEVALSPASGGGGGGGGSSIPSSQIDIRVIPSELGIKTIVGEEREETIIITNDGDKKVSLSFKTEGLEEIIAFSEDSVVLAPREEKEMKVSILVKEKGLYLGKILILSGDELVKEIPVIIDLVSKKFLFDVSVSLKNSRLNLGEKMVAQIDMEQIGQNEEIEITARYIIKDFSGNSYFEEEETFSVEGSKSFTKEFPTSDFSPGKYVFSVEMTYPGEFAITSSRFEILDVPPPQLSPRSLSFIGVILIILISIIVIIWLLMKRKSPL